VHEGDDEQSPRENEEDREPVRTGNLIIKRIKLGNHASIDPCLAIRQMRDHTVRKIDQLSTSRRMDEGGKIT
jgi:hypothetical protein